MAAPLPDFASKWIAQWKQAAPRLQAIQDEELRRLDADGNSRTNAKDTSQPMQSPMRIELVPLIYDRTPERHGMVVMQRWFMRRQLLERRIGTQQEL